MKKNVKAVYKILRAEIEKCIWIYNKPWYYITTSIKIELETSDQLLFFD